MQQTMFMTKFNPTCKERVDTIVLDIVQRRDEEPEAESSQVGIAFGERSESDGTGWSPPPGPGDAGADSTY